MKKKVLFLFVFLTLILAGSAAFPQEDIPLVPIPPKIDMSKIDITGAWNYTASGSSVTGMCPPGPPNSGIVTITGGGGSYTLVFTSGRTCSPASMCTFTGTLSGNQLLFSNSDTVDDEAGSATNALALAVHSNNRIAGEGSSRYVHPDGFECSWSYTIELTR